MANPVEPMIKLDPGGKAPILSYNVPEPTSYSGRNFIELQLPEDYFKAELSQPPGGERTPPAEIDSGALKTAIINGMKSGFADAKLFPNVRVNAGGLRFVDKSNPGLTFTGVVPVSPKLAQIDPDEIASMMQAGKRLNVYRSLSGSLSYNYVPEPQVARPRLLLVETYRLSSFLGSYGAGRVVKTFSLLPGEKTKISVKTYLKSTTDAKSASSILDSFTQESADDFETSVQAEQSSKDSYAESFEYHAEAEAEASWGWGSAKVSGGVKGGTNSAREEFAKNVSSSTQKHASKASAKRDVQVNTSYEVKEETGEETSIEREIQNINLSRTLNFVFRQMNQEFITALHLVDVRVAFFNGFGESRKEVTLPELDSLLEDVVVESRRDEVRDVILGQLQTVFDYKGEKTAVIEEHKIADDDRYWRFKQTVSLYDDEVTGASFKVPGTILSVVKSVMRTEGIIVEALLGEGEALDGYAQRLQEIEVERRAIEVAQARAESERAALMNQLASGSDADKAEILEGLLASLNPAGSPLRIELVKPDA